MRFRLGDGEKIADRYVIGVVVAALVIGIALYNVVPIASTAKAETKPALVATTTTTIAASADVGSGSGSATGGGSSGAFGSAVGALASGTTADEAVAQSNAISTVVPGPSCPTDVVTAAVDDARARVSDAMGVPVPGSAIADLATIASGCSNADPTGPVLSLAIELTALVSVVQSAPATAVTAVTAPASSSSAAAEPSLTGATLPGATTVTTAAPATTTTANQAPAVQVDTVVSRTLPAALIEALGPELDVIRAGCLDVADVGAAADAYSVNDVLIDGVVVQSAVEQAIALCALLGV